MSDPRLNKAKEATPDQMDQLVTVAQERLDHLQQIEEAATAWRRSLECDDWSVSAIEQDAGRPGMSALLRLIPAGSQKRTA